MAQLTRRALVCVVAWGALACWRPADGQAQGKLYRVGYLSPRSKPELDDRHFVDAFLELGWSIGRSLTIEYRWAANDTDRLHAMAEDLVRSGVDVIFADTPPAIDAARRATSRIPIMIMSVADPIAAGWAVSLSRPGGNITGMSRQHDQNR